jgi:succinate-semialdehyde dehydrogenase/glutarate-semialdehyde dehydrogenase
MKIKAINPSNGVVLKEYDQMPQQEVGNSIQESDHAFLGWRKSSFAERADCLRKAAGILRAGAEDYARLMRLGM